MRIRIRVDFIAAVLIGLSLAVFAEGVSAEDVSNDANGSGAESALVQSSSSSSSSSSESSTPASEGKPAVTRRSSRSSSFTYTRTNRKESSAGGQNEGAGGSGNSAGDAGTGDGTGEAVITTRPKMKFVPKFKERLVNLAEQVNMAEGKGFITKEEAAGFIERQKSLLAKEAEASKSGFPRADVDELERSVALLNSDLFKAMRKNDPVKPGPAESEVNDPNLIPAYPDPELQPGSGKK